MKTTTIALAVTVGLSVRVLAVPPQPSPSYRSVASKEHQAAELAPHLLDGEGSQKRDPGAPDFLDESGRHWLDDQGPHKPQKRNQDEVRQLLVEEAHSLFDLRADPHKYDDLNQLDSDEHTGEALVKRSKDPKRPKFGKRPYATCNLSGLQKLAHGKFDMWKASWMVKSPDCFDWNVESSCAPRENVAANRDLALACTRYNFAYQNFKARDAWTPSNKNLTDATFWMDAKDLCTSDVSVNDTLTFAEEATDCMDVVLEDFGTVHAQNAPLNWTKSPIEELLDGAEHID